MDRVVLLAEGRRPALGARVLAAGGLGGLPVLLAVDVADDHQVVDLDHEERAVHDLDVGDNTAHGGRAGLVDLDDATLQRVVVCQSQEGTAGGVLGHENLLR